MKRLRQAWAHIPRPLRAIANILLILLLLFLKWDSLGRPISLDILEYRRTEKMQLLGPGTIVHELYPRYGREEYPHESYNEFSHTIVSETENGIIFCGLDRYSDGQRHTVMTYQEKTGDITLAVPPTDIWDWASWNWEFRLPIYVFHEYPEAVRAEVDVTIRGVWEMNYNSDSFSENHVEPYERSYQLRSIHQTEDFFLLRIEVPDIIDKAFQIENYYLVTQPERVFETMQGPDGDAPQLLSALFNNGLFYNDETGTVLAEIRLYNEQDDLIAQKTITKQAPAEEPTDSQEVQDNEN